MAHRLKNQQRAERLEAGGLRRQRRIHALADPTKVQTFEWMEDASDAQERMPGRSRRGGHGPVTTVTRATRPPRLWDDRYHRRRDTAYQAVPAPRPAPRQTKESSNTDGVKDCSLHAATTNATCPNPKIDAICQRPAVDAACQMPEIGAACQSPEIGATCRGPEIGAACQRPEIGATSQRPTIDAACQRPEIGATSQRPTIDAACQRPEIGATSQRPAIGATSQRPAIVEDRQFKRGRYTRRYHSAGEGCLT